MLEWRSALQSMCSSSTDAPEELQSTPVELQMDDESDTWYSALSESESEHETCETIECQPKHGNDTSNQPRKSLVVYRCSYANCNKEFPLKCRLERHLRSHSNERPFICTIGDCEKSFTCKLYLVKHMKRPHGNKDVPKKEKTHQCEDCGKIYKRKFDLKTHSMIHGGDKPFKCDICGESFAVRQRLKKHSKRHAGYKCKKDNCDFTGDSWSALLKHNAVAHRKLFKCDFCDREYYSQHKLTAHAVIHEGRKYSCNYDNCDRSYSRPYNLQAHIKAVHTNETLKCKYPGCGQEVHYLASYIRHMKIHEQKSNGSVNFGTKKSMAAVLSEIEITKDQNSRILQEDALHDSEVEAA